MAPVFLDPKADQSEPKGLEFLSSCSTKEGGTEELSFFLRDQSSWTSAVFATGKDQAMTRTELALKAPNTFQCTVTFALSYSFCPERREMDDAIINTSAAWAGPPEHTRCSFTLRATELFIELHRDLFLTCWCL